MRYNAVIRGLLNYYSFVDNRYSMNSLIKLFLRPSCAKTLARKFNLNSRAQVFKKFGPLLSFKDGKESTSLHIPSTFTRTRSFNDQNICEPDYLKALNFKIRSHIALQKECIICEDTNQVEMRYLKHIRKGPKSNNLKAIMSALNKKNKFQSVKNATYPSKQTKVCIIA